MEVHELLRLKAFRVSYLIYFVLSFLSMVENVRASTEELRGGTIVILGTVNCRA